VVCVPARARVSDYSIRLFLCFIQQTMEWEVSDRKMWRQDHLYSLQKETTSSYYSKYHLRHGRIFNSFVTLYFIPSIIEIYFKIYTMVRLKLGDV